MPGDQLCDRVFDLQSRVHLKEVEVTIPIDDEFDRPGRAVIDSLRQGDCLFTHRLARFVVEKRGRRLFHNLLVAPLDRAFPLVQVEAVAMFVAQHLNFDMARLGDELFDEDPIIAKAAGGFVLRTLKTFARASSSFHAMRIPLPPPPALALIITG